MSPEIPLPVVNLNLNYNCTDKSGVENELVDAMSRAAALIIKDLALVVDMGRIEIGVTITDDSEIRAMNKKYRGLDKPTDVLSFPLLTDLDFNDIDSGIGPPVAFGDIVISLDTISRQASEREMTLSDRFTECYLHGFLHLLCFDHEAESERLRMESVEDNLLPDLLEIFNRLNAWKILCVNA